MKDVYLGEWRRDAGGVVGAGAARAQHKPVVRLLLRRLFVFGNGGGLRLRRGILRLAATDKTMPESGRPVHAFIAIPNQITEI